MGWLASLIMLVIYFLQSEPNSYLLIAASIFGVAGSIDLAIEKIAGDVLTKITETIMKSSLVSISSSRTTAEVVTDGNGENHIIIKQQGKDD